MAGDSPAAVLVDEVTEKTAEITDERKLSVNLEGQVIDVRLQPVPPPDLADLVNDFAKNGSSQDMRVDGSGVAKEFIFPADGTQDIKLFGIKLVIASDSIKFEGDQFIEDIALTNGVKIEVRSNDNTVLLGNVKRSEDLLSLPLTDVKESLNASKDWLVLTFNFALVIVLKGGSGDFVKVTIRDNVTNNVKNVFEAVVTGVKV